jgi:hypothetical protein
MGSLHAHVQRSSPLGRASDVTGAAAGGLRRGVDLPVAGVKVLKSVCVCVCAGGGSGSRYAASANQYFLVPLGNFTRMN